MKKGGNFLERGEGGNSDSRWKERRPSKLLFNRIRGTGDKALKSWTGGDTTGPTQQGFAGRRSETKTSPSNGKSGQRGADTGADHVPGKEVTRQKKKSESRCLWPRPAGGSRKWYWEGTGQTERGRVGNGEGELVSGGEVGSTGLREELRKKGTTLEEGGANLP